MAQRVPAGNCHPNEPESASLPTPSYCPPLATLEDERFPILVPTTPRKIFSCGHSMNDIDINQESDLFLFIWTCRQHLPWLGVIMLRWRQQRERQRGQKGAKPFNHIPDFQLCPVHSQKRKNEKNLAKHIFFFKPPLGSFLHFPPQFGKKCFFFYHLNLKTFYVSKYIKQCLKKQNFTFSWPHTLCLFWCFFQIFYTSSYDSVRKIPSWLSKSHI